MLKFGSVVGYGLALVGILYLYNENLLFSGNLKAITIQIASLAIMAWARITFGRRSFHLTANATKGELVTTGPYRLLRHPIYASIIYFSWACLIPFPCIQSLIGVSVVTIGLIFRMILEEKSLHETYPEYASYTKKAKRLIPFVF